MFRPNLKVLSSVQPENKDGSILHIDLEGEGVGGAFGGI
jgi:hypothetical protein